MDNNNNLIKNLIRGFFSLVAFFGILFYLYIRFIVKKLPQNLPAIVHPEFSLFLYGWLSLIYIILLIILPLYLKYKKPKDPNKEESEIIKDIIWLYHASKKPFIWLYEYVLMVFPVSDLILKLGEYLFIVRKKYKPITLFVFAFPRLLASLVLFIEVIYFNKIYYFYYVILLSFITICFHLFMLMLQNQFDWMAIMAYENKVGTIIPPKGPLHEIIEVKPEDQINFTQPYNKLRMIYQ